jgi:menaquinone-dependent protoporphyrinogen IX oxidase
VKVLIAYDNRTGHAEKMAEYMAEGVRFSGHEVETKKISEIKNEAALQG